MFKLVVIGGKDRGKEFEISATDFVLGRDSSCDGVINASGVSSRHVKFSASENSLYFEDLGSSNGTFINGKLLSRGEIRAGARVTLPDTIIQVVQVKERPVYVAKEEESEDDHDDDMDEKAFFEGGDPPQSLGKKLVHYFRYKLMKIVYGINEEYEWASLFVIILSFFVVATISITIIPVLRQNRELLLIETAKRGTQYADQIARLNSRALEQKNLDKLDTSFLDREEGVESYELFDLQGRIVRPLGKLNEISSDTFSVKARDWAVFNQNTEGDPVLKTLLGDGLIGVAKPIKAFNSKYSIYETVGVVAIKFAPATLEAQSIRNSRVYLEALISAALLAFLFFAVILYMTKRPIEEFIFQVEQALRGLRRNVEGKYLMRELVPLKSAVNTILRRLRESQGEEDFEDLESDDEYVRILHEISKGIGTPSMVFNAQKDVMHLSSEAEDLIGIRESSSQGENFLDVAREKGLAATIIDLCDRAASNGGKIQEGEYELGGRDYQIFASVLFGRDSYPKAYLLTFVRNE